MTDTAICSPKLRIGNAGLGGKWIGAMADGWIRTFRPGSRGPGSTTIQRTAHRRL